MTVALQPTAWRVHVKYLTGFVLGVCAAAAAYIYLGTA